MPKDDYVFSELDTGVHVKPSVVSSSVNRSTAVNGENSTELQGTLPMVVIDAISVEPCVSGADNAMSGSEGEGGRSENLSYRAFVDGAGSAGSVDEVVLKVTTVVQHFAVAENQDKNRKKTNEGFVGDKGALYDDCVAAGYTAKDILPTGLKRPNPIIKTANAGFVFDDMCESAESVKMLKVNVETATLNGLSAAAERNPKSLVNGVKAVDGGTCVQDQVQDIEANQCSEGSRSSHLQSANVIRSGAVCVISAIPSHILGIQAVADPVLIYVKEECESGKSEGDESGSGDDLYIWEGVGEPTHEPFQDMSHGTGEETLGAKDKNVGSSNACNNILGSMGNVQACVEHLQATPTVGTENPNIEGAVDVSILKQGPNSIVGVALQVKASDNTAGNRSSKEKSRMTVKYMRKSSSQRRESERLKQGQEI